MVIWYVILTLLAIYFLYLCYKVLWYLTKIIMFQSKLKKLRGDGCHIQRERIYWSMFFGKKCVLDFTVTIQNQKFNVYLLSFLSTRGRWNIEKGENCYYAEARRYNRVFYNAYRNSSDEPEHSRDFRRESPFWKCLFHLPKEKASSNDKQIVLAYPTPRLLTYTDKKLEYLQSGNTFDGYTVMLWDDFLNFLKSGMEGNHE